MTNGTSGSGSNNHNGENSNQPLWDPRGWPIGDPYAPAFEAIHNEAVPEHQPVEEEEDPSEEEPFEEEDHSEDEEEPMEEEDPSEEEVEEEEPMEEDEQESYEVLYGPTDEPSDDEEVQSEVRTSVKGETEAMVPKSMFDEASVRCADMAQRYKGMRHVFEELTEACRLHQEKHAKNQESMRELRVQLRSNKRHSQAHIEVQDKEIKALKKRVQRLQQCIPGPGKRKCVIEANLRSLEEDNKKNNRDNPLPAM